MFNKWWQRWDTRRCSLALDLQASEHRRPHPACGAFSPPMTLWFISFAPCELSGLRTFSGTLQWELSWFSTGTADTIEFRCGEKIVDSLYFTGLKLIRVPEGCWAGSAFFNLQAGAMVYSEDALLKLALVTIDTGLLRHHPESNISAMAQLLLDTWDTWEHPYFFLFLIFRL